MKPKQAVSRVLSWTIIYLRGGQIGGCVVPPDFRMPNPTLQPRGFSTHPDHSGAKSVARFQNSNIAQLFTFYPAEAELE